MSDAELLALWSVSQGRLRLTGPERERLGAMLAEVRREGIPRGWRWDEAKVQARMRRAAELLSVSGFAA